MAIPNVHEYILGYGTGIKYRIVCFGSANYRGGFFIRQNLSVDAKEVKNLLGAA